MNKSADLLHPIYLDIPMMISFVAFLEGGYSLEKASKLTNDVEGDITGSIDGEAGLPNMLANLAKASIKATGSAEGKISRAEESQITYKHTEASLFMRLRHNLRREGRIISLDECEQHFWDNIPVSSLVEISGEIYRSPVNEIAQITRRIMPFMLRSLPIKDDGTVDIGQLSNEQKNLFANLSLMEVFCTDAETASVADILLKHKGTWEKQAVLDIPVKSFPLSDQELLRCGYVTVIGKATRILGHNDSINLYRRSVLGYMAQSMIEEMGKSFNGLKDLGSKLEAPIVKYPAVEIIPMAIYV